MIPKLLSFIKTAIFGAIIGPVFAVPGLSGSTIAIVLGIYDKIIASIAKLFKDWKTSLLFLVPLAIGAAGGLYAFAGIASYAFEEWPMATNFLFAGLIIGITPILLGYALDGTGKNDEDGIQQATSPFISIIVATITFSIMIAIIVLAPNDMANTVHTELTPWLAVWLFVVASIAAADMLLPGISGAMMFVIFGAYGTVITAVKDLNIIMLLPVAAGALVGILLFARVIHMLLIKYERATYAGALGLMAGSVAQLAFESRFNEPFNAQFWAAWGLLFAGMAVAYAFGRLGAKREKETKAVDTE